MVKRITHAFNVPNQDGLPDSPEGWSWSTPYQGNNPVPGVIDVVSGWASWAGSTYNVRAEIDLDSPDMAVSGWLVGTTQVDSRAGLIARYDSASQNGYVLHHRRNDWVYLYKLSNGTLGTPVAEYNLPGIHESGYYDLVVVGDTVRVYRGGDPAPIIEWTDPLPYQFTRAGMSGAAIGGADRARVHFFVAEVVPFGLYIPKTARRNTRERITVSGDWIKPEDARFIRVTCVGGGGGGASGRNALSGGNSRGGGAGTGGGLSSWVYRAEDVPNVVPITIGAGGAGGPGFTSGQGNGLSGTAGGRTSFGELLTAVGGNAGYLGDANSGIGSVTSAPTTGATDLPTNSNQDNLATRAAGSGGSGGGTSGSTPITPIAGGSVAALGVPGGAINNNGVDGEIVGSGGGGAEANTNIPGGDGGFPGGGGGGGGSNSGGPYGSTPRGGNGANGIVLIEVMF